MNFSENLLCAMKANNMTQKELASRIGITEATLSRYVSGVREPKAETIANMATVLKTTSDFLLGIETVDINVPGLVRILARNSNKMSDEEKKNILGALF